MPCRMLALPFKIKALRKIALTLDHIKIIWSTEKIDWLQERKLTGYTTTLMRTAAKKPHYV